MSFIGSAEIGWYLRSKLSSGTRYALEHGGVAPVIIEPDADFQDALPLLIKGGFYHAGQVCVSVQKIFVHESKFNEFSEKYGKAASELKTGDPLNPEIEVGPLISKEETNRIEKWVNNAKNGGGKIICGGKRINNYSFEPTVILNPPENSELTIYEVFGPVVCIYSYKDIDEAIKKANSLAFAFQSAVFTKNIDTAFKCVNNLNASAVMINDHTAFRVDWMPFGGRDDSGIGIGGIPYSMHEMTREKLMIFRSKEI